MLQSLHVEVSEGKDLKDKDLFGKSDPYVVLQVGGEKHQTTVKKGTLNPVWHEKFTFSSGPMLSVEVWDKDKISKDDLMGQGDVRLDESLLARLRGGKVQHWVPLFLKGKDAGDVRLELDGVFAPRPGHTPNSHSPNSHSDADASHANMSHAEKAELARRLRMQIAQEEAEQRRLNQRYREMKGPLEQELRDTKAELARVIRDVDRLGQHVQPYERGQPYEVDPRELAGFHGPPFQGSHAPIYVDAYGPAHYDPPALYSYRDYDYHDGYLLDGPVYMPPAPVTTTTLLSPRVPANDALVTPRIPAPTAFVSPPAPVTTTTYTTPRAPVAATAFTSPQVPASAALSPRFAATSPFIAPPSPSGSTNFLSPRLPAGSSFVTPRAGSEYASTAYSPRW